MTTISVHRPDDLGPLLGDVRLELGVTQSALAAKAKVGREWLNAFELGDKWTAPLDMVYRVLSALEVTVEMVPEPAPHPDPDDDLIDLNELLDRTLEH
ncbi:helix-turn-helix domain-containing protein [Corynebacterium glyciniphilum]|uniref:helix-turn-helix domain-containing protein n=1 Tax=Corynebacterium glyciniphilum TaxID=1404244 RepID=UPI0011AB6DE1|nr:helix-turn-helix transcriptional regulator [Corynebacterium glyciniphilum]